MSVSHGSGQILHIDMNAFYCSCHAAAEPLKFARRPTAVAGNPETRHGIVVTASYEARRRGVRATMTVQQAVRACPDLTLISPDFQLYRDFSQRVFALIQEYTPQVEVFSIDECWADVSGCSQFGTPLDIATQIQKRIQSELQLPCSIGIGPNKFVAKMASDLKKPLGITEISSDDVVTKLWPLPVEQMFGVGKSSAERLQRLAIRTIGDLAAADLRKLAPLFGKRSFTIHEHANGRDPSPVSSEQEAAKSVGHSITLSADTSDFEELSTVLLNLSDQVGRRVRRHKRVGKTVQLTLRFANRNTITRSKTLAHATDLTEDIYKTAQYLLCAHKQPEQKVRLLGVSLTHLSEGHNSASTSPQGQQLDLFGSLGLAPTSPSQAAGDTSASGVARNARSIRSTISTPSDDLATSRRLRKLTDVTDRLRDKYGEDIVVRGRMLQRHESTQLRDGRSRGTSLQKDNIRPTLPSNLPNDRNDRNDRNEKKPRG